MLTKERKGEIAYALWKHRLKKGVVRLDKLDREIGKIAKVTNIPFDELREFVREIADEPMPEVEEEYNENLFRNLYEIEFSMRVSNALRTMNIRMISDLVQRTGSEMLKIKGFGRHSLAEVKMALSELGLSLGMRIDPVELQRMRDKYERPFNSER